VGSCCGGIEFAGCRLFLPVSEDLAKTLLSELFRPGAHLMAGFQHEIEPTRFSMKRMWTELSSNVHPFSVVCTVWQMEIAQISETYKLYKLKTERYKMDKFVIKKNTFHFNIRVWCMRPKRTTCFGSFVSGGRGLRSGIGVSLSILSE